MRRRGVGNPHLILLHPPAVYDFRKQFFMYGPIADGVPSTPLFEMYPVGFISLMEHLEREGVTVRIINLAARMLASERFDAEKMIRTLKPQAFGIDFHWLAHAHGSLEVAKLCKRHHPDTPVICGGLSATYFHRELIRYPEVDFIIRGDSAEEPLLQLMKVIIYESSTTTTTTTALSDIPNLVWKNKEGDVQVNPLSHVPSEVKCSNNYVKVFKSAFKHLDFKSLIPYHGWSHEWFHYPIMAVITCRGCIHNCIFCGGSRSALADYCNRTEPTFRDPHLIVEDIATITKYTKAPIFIIGDLRQPGREYAHTVLDGLKRLNIENQIVIELFTTAPQEYFEEVAASLKNFNFEISPDTHDERIRALIGKPYTNEAIEDNLTWALDLGCKRFDLFFMIGLPYQTCESVMETVNWCGQLMETFGERVVPFILPYSPFIDPGCIAYENPETFGYKILFKTLEEYREAMLAPSWKYILNYETAWMSRDEIVDCTYQVGLKLNKLKVDCGLIAPGSFRAREGTIKRAIELTAAIDEIVTLKDADERHERLMRLKPDVDTMLSSVINEKRGMEWPTAGGNLRIFNIFRATVSEQLRR